MNLAAWRSDLTAVIARGLAAHPRDEILTALLDAGAELSRTTPSPLAPAAPVLGVDACPAGWVGVLLRPAGPMTVHVAASITALVEQVRESEEPAVVAIDIPIGLPDRGGRAADVLARRALPGKGSSVFPTPTRAAYTAASYEDAKAQNVAATAGRKSISKQAWALRPKVLEVDAWVRSRPTVAVIEVHPELSFARMAGAPVLSKKHGPDGSGERRLLLSRVGIAAPHWYRGPDFGEDDLLDACAATWTAARYLDGEAESLPEVPEIFSDGLPAAIWV